MYAVVPVRQGKEPGELVLEPAAGTFASDHDAQAWSSWAVGVANEGGGHRQHAIVRVTGDARQKRALSGRWQLRAVKMGWKIIGPTGHTYEVTRKGRKGLKCSCPDYLMRGVVCKHIYAVQMVEEKGGRMKEKEAPPAGTDWQAALARPFAVEHISWKPQEYSKDGLKAKAVAYAGLRAYEDRLNQVVPGEWNSRVQVVNAQDRVVCIVHLTVKGMTRAGVGECSVVAVDDDEPVATAAYAQAFKRACSTFGLGRYLYNLPKEWVDCDEGHLTLAAVEHLVGLYKRFCGEENGAQPTEPEEKPAGNNKPVEEPPAKEESRRNGNGNKPPLASLAQRRRLAVLLKQVGYKTADEQRAALKKAEFHIPLSEPEAELAYRKFEALKKGQTSH